MLSPEIANRLDRLLAFHTEGIFTEDEFAEHLGHLVTADNAGAVVERLPAQLLAAVKRGVRLDNERAAGNESLHPEDSPLDSAIFGKYYRKVAEALLEPDVPKRRAVISVVCLPSFDAEWALRLLGAEKRGYTLALSMAERQIWSSQLTESVGVKRMEIALTAEWGALLSEVWRKMLLRVRHPESNGCGLDGVTYHFACRGAEVGFMAGKTWSPRSETAPGKLVALCHLLFRYVVENDMERRKLVGEIDQAAAWFKILS